MNPAQVSVKPDPVKPVGKPRNLTHEGIRAHLEQNKAAEVAATPAYEVVKVHLPVRDDKGNVVKNAQGFVKLEEQAVLKRDLVAAEFDEKIAAYPG